MRIEMSKTVVIVSQVVFLEIHSNRFLRVEFKPFMLSHAVLIWTGLA